VDPNQPSFFLLHFPPIQQHVSLCLIEIQVVAKSNTSYQKTGPCIKLKMKKQVKNSINNKSSSTKITGSGSTIKLSN
jgi:hypothetical protein